MCGAFYKNESLFFSNKFLVSVTGLHHGNLASKNYAPAVRTIAFSWQVPISNHKEGESLLSPPPPPL